LTISVLIPGRVGLALDHLLLDVNGTLTDRGTLLADVAPRIARLGEALEIRLVSADTFGTLGQVAELLGVTAVRAGDGADKLRVLDELGRDRCAVIGNGMNDALVLKAAAIGFAVVGPEGASTAAVLAADIVCSSVAHALDLILEPEALSATLRP
jgi:soluble P-type ATPase